MLRICVKMTYNTQIYALRTFEFTNMRPSILGLGNIIVVNTIFQY